MENVPKSFEKDNKAQMTKLWIYNTYSLQYIIGTEYVVPYRNTTPSNVTELAICYFLKSSIILKRL